MVLAQKQIRSLVEQKENPDMNSWNYTHLIFDKNICLVCISLFCLRVTCDNTTVWRQPGADKPDKNVSLAAINFKT
jgi:hypothetical protein